MPADGTEIERAQTIVRKFYPEMPSTYVGRRVQIAIEAARSKDADLSWALSELEWMASRVGLDQSAEAVITDRIASIKGKTEDPRLTEASRIIHEKLVQFKAEQTRLMVEAPEDFETATADDFALWFAEFGMDDV